MKTAKIKTEENNNSQNIWKKEINQDLLSAFLLLDNKKEAQDFLRDLLTESEINEFAKRLETAKLLSQKVSYKKIEEKTSLSSTTIARISKWLSANNGGYKNILEKLHHHNSHKTEFFDNAKIKDTKKNKKLKT